MTPARPGLKVNGIGHGQGLWLTLSITDSHNSIVTSSALRGVRRSVAKACGSCGVQRMWAW